MTQPPLSATLARAFLDKRIDWVSPQSPYFGKTYQEVISPKKDPGTQRTIYSPILQHIIEIDGNMVYQNAASELVESILNILPDYTIIKDLDVIKIVHLDPDKIIPALEEFIQDHPEHDAAKLMGRLVKLLNDFTTDVYNPGHIIQKAATNASLLVTPGLQQMASVNKMQEAQAAMQKLIAHFGEQLDIPNRATPVTAWDDKKSPFVQSGESLGEMIDILQTIHDDLEKLIAQVKKERGPSTGTPDSNVQPR